MNLLTGFISLAILSATIVSSSPITRRDVNETLVPQFGFSAGVNPTGTGDCDGAVNGTNGQPVQIPCSCPPDRATFIQSLNANVAAGHVLNNPSVPISFPEDNSTASQLARINAATVTLQNLNGSGQGCPVASTTFQAQAAAINISSNPQPAEFILMARQLSSLSSPTPTVSFNSPLGGIPTASDSELATSPIPTVSLITTSPLGVIPTASDSESALLPSPIPTISFHFPPVVEDILARDSESASSPVPTATISFVSLQVVGDILARQETPTPSPVSTIDFVSVTAFGDILARQETPSPTPTPEIVLAGPPLIE